MLTFGSDPEFMLEKDGRFFSAIPLVPGTKHKRHEMGHHFAYWDNVMAECAVEPAESKAEFVSHLRDCLQRYAALMKPYRLVARASADFPAEELACPDAQAIGCDPEYCAYELQQAVPPEDDFKKNTLRTAGGHIHLGTPVGKNPFGCIAIIRMMDLFAGTASIFLDKDKTTKRRKELYGKAGRFRQPDWGVEYRSLSNFWLTSPTLVGLILDIAAFAVEFVEEKKYEQLWTIDFDRLNDDRAWNTPGFHPSQCHHCTGYDIKELRHAIDTMDKRQGKKFLEYIYQFLPRKLFDKILELSECGPYDLYQEWKLK